MLWALMRLVKAREEKETRKERVNTEKEEKEPAKAQTKVRAKVKVVDTTVEDPVLRRLVKEKEDLSISISLKDTATIAGNGDTRKQTVGRNPIPSHRTAVAARERVTKVRVNMQVPLRKERIVRVINSRHSP